MRWVLCPVKRSRHIKGNSIPQQSGAVETLAPFLRLDDVLKTTGLGRSTVYRMVAARTFPAPVKLAKRAVGWRQDDVRQWANGRPSTSL